jgi:hypothetical protein
MRSPVVRKRLRRSGNKIELWKKRLQPFLFDLAGGESNSFCYLATGQLEQTTVTASDVEKDVLRFDVDSIENLPVYKFSEILSVAPCSHDVGRPPDL